MKALEELRVSALGVRHDQVLMGGHERDGVDQDTELTGAQGERVQIDLPDGGIRAKEVMTEKGAPGDHEGVAGHDGAGLGHAGQGEHEAGHHVAVSFQHFAVRDLADILPLAVGRQRGLGC
jgi:hypothetical protein